MNGGMVLKSTKKGIKMDKKWFTDPLIRNTIILSSIFALKELYQKEETPKWKK